MPDPIKELEKRIKELEDNQDYIIQKLERCLKLYNTLLEFFRFISAKVKE